ncbi:hypothetical protein HOLleu_42178 [Holothuria leucospilota]|uniref:Uncharacterized protein n=1 Tax=Holothuria leucospilota TaxID=206669 RepID=A0A9Q0YAM3_HOLLE|nr:hypothetical protein HOLleu_42178 [Holothuria leucospilota]
MNSRQQLRKKQRVDYKALANGPLLPKCLRQIKESWSTKKLYELEIIDQKVVNEIETRFKSELQIAVKESLHCNRKCDSLVELSIPLPRDTFKVMTDCGVQISSKPGKWTLHELTDLNEVIGKDWYYRIVNRFSDFSYVKKGSFTYWPAERPPLHEYNFSDSGLSSKFTHRGFALKVKFVRGIGNKFDFESYIANSVNE